MRYPGSKLDATNQAWMEPGKIVSRILSADILHDTTDVAEGLIALCSHEHVLVCPKYGVPKILVISYHHVPH